jgi:hypothetical protein
MNILSAIRRFFATYELHSSTSIMALLKRAAAFGVKSCPPPSLPGVAKVPTLLEIAREMAAKKAASAAAALAEHKVEEVAEAAKTGTPPELTLPAPSAHDPLMTLRMLGALETIAKRVTAGTTPYMSVRQKLLKIQEQLNHRHSVAPAFRPLVPPSKFRGQPEGVQILFDQQLIDIHWAAVSGRDVETTAEQVIRAVREQGIEASAAFEFVLLQRRMKAKAASFELSPLYQLGCILLCEDGRRIKRNKLIGEARRHKRVLTKELDRRTSTSPRSLERVEINRLCAAWLARELHPLLESKKKRSDASVARILGLILGEETSANVVRHQLKQVIKHIDKGPVHTST